MFAAFGLGGFEILLLALVGLVFGGLGLGFWIWMLVDCVRKETRDNDKLVWVLIIVFLHFLGALIYFFVRKMPRKDLRV
jgi:hypothetical protein